MLTIPVYQRAARAVNGSADSERTHSGEDPLLDRRSPA